MHALKLTTRFKEDAYQGDACLFVYDEQMLSSTMLSDDVRDLFEARPSTLRIYILAPFLSEGELRECFLSDVLFSRVRNYFHVLGGRLFLMAFRDVGGKKVSYAIPFSTNEKGEKLEEQPQLIENYLRNGWLFDLFDKYSGKVDAPTGVHFGKLSGKHANKFLRVSGVLLTSAACATIAYFTLDEQASIQPKRIFVDTASLLSVAFAMQRIANKQGIWELECPIRSFSSYGGVTQLPPPSGSDLVLISASTSGGLAAVLIDRGFSENLLTTLYFLDSQNSTETKGAVICDLTFNAGQSFGYPKIENHQSNDCPLCHSGYFLAELEGDQFQLEKRSIKTLLVQKQTQKNEARDTLEILARKQILEVKIFNSASSVSEFSLIPDDVCDDIAELRNKIIRALKRFLPTPVHYIVLADISEECFLSLIDRADLKNFIGGAQILSLGGLSEAQPVSSGGALVIFGVLDDFSAARDINARLRTVVPKGCVSYLAALTFADSAEHLSDLKSFLTYGEEGKETFTYYSAANLMLPLRGDEISPWQLELESLLKIRDDDVQESEIQTRIDILLEGGQRNTSLFWAGTNGELEIKNDFVYLDTTKERESISQADIYATVCNLIATLRADNRGLAAAVTFGKEPVKWRQSVYGNTLLDPRNFELYNDAILHAAFLRAANSSELKYFSDQNLSTRMYAVIDALISRWSVGGGDSLPEFLISLISKRLTLTAADTFKLKETLTKSQLPSFLKAFGAYI